MDIRQLRYFIAVAEELHFGKAAKRLNISQPPLSRQINELEGYLGVQLFSRTKRHVELTDAGEFLQKKAYKLIREFEDTIESTRNIYMEETNLLKIGYTGILSTFLIKSIQQYRKKFPKVEIILIQLSSKDQIRAFYENEIQFGFICPPYDSNSFDYRLIRRTQFVAALPVNHALAKDESPIDLLELKNEPFIIPPRTIEQGYYDTIIAACKNAGFVPNILQKAGGIHSVLNLVESNFGVSIVSKTVLEKPDKRIVFRELKPPVPSTELYLVWKKDDISSIMKNFIMVIDSNHSNAQKSLKEKLGVK